MPSRMILVISLLFIIEISRNYVTGDIESQPYKVCNTTACREYAEDFLDSMDPLLTQPCSDFYQFVCGNWNQKYPLQSDRIDTIVEWNTLVDKRLINILKTQQSEDTVATQNAKYIYYLCTDQLDDSGLNYLRNFLDFLGGWPIILPKDQWNASIRWQDVDMVASQFSLQKPFYIINATTNSNENSQYTLVSFPVVHNPEMERMTMKQVINIISAGNLNVSKDSIDEDISEVVNFMNNLTRIISKHASYGGYTTIGGLQVVYDESNNNTNPQTQINWVQVLQSFYSMYTVNEDVNLYVYNLEYFKLLGPLLNETSPRTIVNYVIWYFIRPLLKYISESTRDIENFPNGVINRYSNYYREIVCLKEPNFQHAINYEYIKKYTPPEVINSARDILENIRSVLKKQILELDWMDDNTKHNIAEHISNISVELSGPDWYSDAAIDEYYKDVDVTSIYLETVLNIKKFQVSVNAKQIGDTYNDMEAREWYSLPPLTNNAHYSSVNNKIRMTANALSGYYYKKDLPLAVNYGLLGTVLAHEFVHGYDTERMNKIYGRAWMNHSMERYENMTNCYIEQYNKFELPKMDAVLNTIDGLLTLSENIADTGIMIAFQALQTSDYKKNETRIVKMENFTSEQLFFISRGMISCESLAQDTAVHPLISMKETHLPMSIRLRGALSNSPQFAAVFHCPKDTLMNPSKKCELWDNDWFYWKDVEAQRRRRRK